MSDLVLDKMLLLKKQMDEISLTNRGLEKKRDLCYGNIKHLKTKIKSEQFNIRSLDRQMHSNQEKYSDLSQELNKLKKII